MQILVYQRLFCLFASIIVNELIKVPSLPDWSNSKQEEYMLLQDDGT